MYLNTNISWLFCMIMMNTLKDADCQGGLKENNNYMILTKQEH